MPPTLSRTHLPLLALAVLIPDPLPMVCVSAPLVSVADEAVVVLSVPSLSLLLLLLLLLLFGLAGSDPDSDITWDTAIRLSSVAIRREKWQRCDAYPDELFPLALD